VAQEDLDSATLRLAMAIPVLVALALVPLLAPLLPRMNHQRRQSTLELRPLQLARHLPLVPVPPWVLALNPAQDQHLGLENCFLLVLHRNL
jgi:hypothetical protein